MTAGTGEVQYLVLPDATNPYLLARVRWPDVFQAISPVRPDWQDDPGLFDLPYDPSSTPVTSDKAAAIAADWGAHLPSDETGQSAKIALVRRMPANWSDLSRAERRAWSIEYPRSGKPATPADERPSEARVAPVGSRLGRLRVRRRAVEPAVDPSEVLHEELLPDLDLTEDMIDLTDTREDVVAGVEEA